MAHGSRNSLIFGLLAPIFAAFFGTVLGGSFWNIVIVLAISIIGDPVRDVLDPENAQ